MQKRIKAKTNSAQQNAHIELNGDSGRDMTSVVTVRIINGELLEHEAVFGDTGSHRLRWNFLDSSSRIREASRVLYCNPVCICSLARQVEPLRLDRDVYDDDVRHFDLATVAGHAARTSPL